MWHIKNAVVFFLWSKKNYCDAVKITDPRWHLHFAQSQVIFFLIYLSIKNFWFFSWLFLYFFCQLCKEKDMKMINNLGFSFTDSKKGLKPKVFMRMYPKTMTQLLRKKKSHFKIPFNLTPSQPQGWKVLVDVPCEIYICWDILSTLSLSFPYI